MTNTKFPGNPTRSYRTRHPLKVIGEIAGWIGHSNGEVARMKASIKRMKDQGVEAIND